MRVEYEFEREVAFTFLNREVVVILRDPGPDTRRKIWDSHSKLIPPKEDEKAKEPDFDVDWEGYWLDMILAWTWKKGAGMNGKDMPITKTEMKNDSVYSLDKTRAFLVRNIMELIAQENNLMGQRKDFLPTMSASQKATENKQVREVPQSSNGLNSAEKPVS